MTGGTTAARERAAQPQAPRPQQARRWSTGRGELWVAGGVLALAGALAWGTATMEVPAGVAAPGPQFFPWLVVGLLAVVGVALGAQVLLQARRAHADGGAPATMSNDLLEDLGAIDGTSELRIVSPADAAPAPGEDPEDDGARLDVRTIALTVAALAGFAIALTWLGWILSAAALFWALARLFGSGRPLLDVGVAVIVASVIQLAFGAGLGLPLPAGILEGVVPWTS